VRKPRLLIFASGTADGGGSGFEKLVLASREGVLSAEIIGVVSNHERGGVQRRADKLGIHFIHFSGPWTAEQYALFYAPGVDFIALSGWLKRTEGLDPGTTFNIHPGPLPEFGGKGMHGHHVHEAVLAAYKRGELTHSAVCMHFVTAEYDEGPVFFRINVPIQPDDTPDSLAKRVNEQEHIWQPRITDMVLQREISWDGVSPSSLKVPAGYGIVRFAA
jgi:phosphoribosylglycinamide formyltransferase-1